MNCFLTILSIAALTTTKLLASIIKVPVDQPAIQSAINVANEGDTVLVSVGTYRENLNFNGKNIVLGSYFLLTQDTSYISRTIIDGNLNDRVMTFANGEDSTAKLIGFTIENGSAHRGGAIFCRNSNPTLSNLTIRTNYSTYDFFGETPGDGGGIYCLSSRVLLEDVIMEDNIATGGGGGIFALDSQLRLRNTKIINNEAADIGGGIRCSNSNLYFADVTVAFNQCFNAGGGISFDNSNLEFDTKERSNIYLNVAPYGRELQNVGQALTDIFVDTFTVSMPSNYFANPVERFTFDIINSKIIQEEADLYVAHSGSDNNNGLSPDAPLQTVTMALLKVVVDSLNLHTIHLGRGFYSPSTTGESFPLYLRNYVSLSGEDKTNTILDAENKDRVIYAFEANNVTVENITIQHGSALRGGGAYLLYSNLILRNILFRDNEAWSGAAIHCDNSGAKITDNEILSNEATYGGGGVYSTNANATVMRNIFKDNSAREVGGAIAGSTSTIIENTFISNSANTGGAIHSEAMGNNHLVLKNIFANNSATWGGAMAINWSEPKLINNTIFKNTATNGGGLFCWQNASPILVNNILWDNQGGEIILDGASITVRYSDIRGGWQGQGNIDADPLFVDPANQNFDLKTNSFCVDAATPFFLWHGDTLVNLAPTDYVGAAPDMGAMEHDLDSAVNSNHQPPHQFRLLQNYPNPFNAVTTISFELPRTTFVTLSIYNIDGQLVEVLVNNKLQTGFHKIQWNAVDRSSGVYYYFMKLDKFAAMGRCLLLK